VGKSVMGRVCGKKEREVCKKIQIKEGTEGKVAM